MSAILSIVTDSLSIKEAIIAESLSIKEAIIADVICVLRMFGGAEVSCTSQLDEPDFL